MLNVTERPALVGIVCRRQDATGAKSERGLCIGRFKVPQESVG